MTNPAALPDPGTDGTCDPGILAELADLFGPARLLDLLAGLDGEIVHRLEGLGPDDPGLAGQAHALVSISGTLGFLPLSRACAALEAACVDGDGRDVRLRAVREEAGQARRVIAILRRQGGGTPSA